MALPHKIAVVGQGLMGLTCASRLLEKGHSVTLFSKEPFENTTSMAAGAYWWPHQTYPEERVSVWAKETLDQFKIDREHPETGIHFEEHFRFCLDPDDGAYARHLLDEWEEIDGKERGIPSVEAYHLEVPVIDVPVFMPYLKEQVLAAGGLFVLKELKSPTDLFPQYDLVINCTGVWARHFVNDESVYPVRGQAVRLSAIDNLKASTRLYQKDDKFTLILPREQDILLGGTAQENDWDRTPREEDTHLILERCKALVPELEGCEVLGASAGLRPGRPEVRLELELMAPNQPVIHNYGHGGGGFTVAWGCANEVTALADQYLNS